MLFLDLHSAAFFRAELTQEGLLATCNMSDVGPLFRDSASVGESAKARGSYQGALGFTPLMDSASHGQVRTARVHANLTCDDWQNQVS